MGSEYNPYVLPTIDFVGGETQELEFNVYFYVNKKPFDLSGCESNFSVVSYTNRMGAPLVSKAMEAIYNDEGTAHNVLTVKLLPTETVDLFGKYIYQITIKDIDGDVEIPKQGILYITNNINRSWVL